MLNKKRILYIDILGYGIPTSYYWIKFLKNQNNIISYIGSDTLYNQEYFEGIKRNTFFQTYNISKTIKISIFIRIFNLIRLYLNIIIKGFKNQIIIYRWLPIPLIDVLIIYLFRNKVIYLCDNDDPHEGDKKNIFTININKKIIYIPHFILGNVLREIWFPSQYTLEIFKKKYFSNKTMYKVIKHPLLGISLLSKQNQYKLLPEFNKFLYWGLIAKYKGIENLIKLSNDIKKYKYKDYSLEIHGKWKNNQKFLKEKFNKDRTLINDKFLSEDEVEKIMANKAIFLLPYNSASQSGILYNLIFYGKYFLTTDVGDNGIILKKYKLECFITKDFSLKNILKKIKYINANNNQILNNLNNFKNHYIY